MVCGQSPQGAGAEGLMSIWGFGGGAVLALALARFPLSCFGRGVCQWRDGAQGRSADRRQSRYEHLSALDNPSRDADAMGKLLERLGFGVTQVREGSSNAAILPTRPPRSGSTASPSMPKTWLIDFERSAPKAMVEKPP